MLEPLDESATLLHGFGKFFLHSYKLGNRVKVMTKPCQSDDKPCQSDDAKNGKNAYPPGERPHFL
nr:MAG TPA: hypothetical protein [Caudoviricetes sp.]